MPPKPKKAITNVSKNEDELINTCVFGSMFDKRRAEACKELAKRCFWKKVDSDKEFTSKMLLKDIEVKNIPDPDSGFIMVGGEMHPAGYYQEYEFDADDYVERKKKEEFGICNIALHGIERQFEEQVGKGLFQSDWNADAVHYVQGLAFKTFNSPREKKFFRRFKSMSEERKKAIILPGKSIEDVVVNDYYYAEEKKYYRLCNDVINPRLPSGKYRICSVVSNRGGEKEIEIREKIHDIYMKTSSLDCIHSFLEFVNYPEQVKQMWDEIEVSVATGELTEEEAIKMIDDLKDLETQFTERLEKGTFQKPVKTMPLRVELYGLQHFLNNLINNVLITTNVQDVLIDDIIYNTLKRGFEDDYIFLEYKLEPDFIKKITEIITHDEFRNYDYEFFYELETEEVQDEALRERAIYKDIIGDFLDLAAKFKDKIPILTVDFPTNKLQGALLDNSFVLGLPYEADRDYIPYHDVYVLAETEKDITIKVFLPYIFDDPAIEGGIKKEFPESPEAAWELFKKHLRRRCGNYYTYKIPAGFIRYMKLSDLKTILKNFIEEYITYIRRLIKERVFGSSYLHNVKYENVKETLKKYEQGLWEIYEKIITNEDRIVR